MSTTIQTETDSIRLSGAQKPDVTNVDINYLRDRPENRDQPIDFDVEYSLGTKDKDTRRLEAINVRSLSNDGKDDGLDLENAGFQFVYHHSDFLADLEKREKEVGNSEDVTDEMWHSVYGKELEDALQEAMPGMKIQHFEVMNHVVRAAPRATEKGAMSNAYAPDAGTPPVPRVHIDIADEMSRQRIASMFGEEQEARWREEGKRTMFFSFWRPLETVQRDPLGAIDARTVDPRDLVRMTRIFPPNIFNGQPQEILLLQASPSGEKECKHQWYWMRAQTVDDLLIIKLNDSEGTAERDMNGRLRAAPHCSFEIAGTGEKPTRKSVEVRAVAIFE